MRRRDGKIGCAGWFLLIALTVGLTVAVGLHSGPPAPDPQPSPSAGPVPVVRMPPAIVRPPARRVEPPKAPAPKAGEYRAGEIVSIVNDHGALYVAIRTTAGVLRLPNPTRARIMDGVLRTRDGLPLGYEVEVLDGEHAGRKGVAGVNALRR